MTDSIPNDNDITTLPLKVGTHESLKRYGIKGQKWDDILKVMMIKSDLLDVLINKVNGFNPEKSNETELFNEIKAEIEKFKFYKVN